MKRVRGTLDTYAGIDSLVRDAVDPIDALNRAIYTTNRRLNDLDVESDTMDFRKHINGKSQLLNQLRVLTEKKHDLEYGTHNFEIHRLEMEEIELERRIELASVFHKSVLLIRLQIVKRKLLRLRLIDEPINEKISQEGEKSSYSPEERIDGMVDPMELLEATEPSYKNMELYRYRRREW